MKQDIYVEKQDGLFVIFAEVMSSVCRTHMYVFVELFEFPEIF